MHDRDASAEELNAALETLLLRELSATWRQENWASFGDAMREPVLSLTDSRAVLGRWRREVRGLEISRRLVLDREWSQVIEVLRHEMAHQYVDEVLGIHDETAHGASFAKVCAERAIDGRAAGMPDSENDAATDRVLDKIRRLLALAGSPERHEAEAAMRKARELMLRYNLESLELPRDIEIRQIGDPNKRRTRVEREIIRVLVDHFFVCAILVPTYDPRTAKRGHRWELSGTRANLAMAEHVWAFLNATCEQLYRADRASLKSGHEKLAYMAGVVRGFGEKLEAQKVIERGAGLVWVGDGELDSFYRRRYPKVSRRSVRERQGQAHALGREKGRAVILHRPIESGPSGGAPKLLRGG